MLLFVPTERPSFLDICKILDTKSEIQNVIAKFNLENSVDYSVMPDQNAKSTPNLAASEFEYQTPEKK